MSYSLGSELNPSTITARGVRISLTLTPKADGKVIAAIYCPAPGLNNSGWLAVYLKALAGPQNLYARIDCHRLASLEAAHSEASRQGRIPFPLLPDPLPAMRIGRSI